MYKQLEIEALQADLESVRLRLASRTREQDPIGFRQFSARLVDLERRLAELTNQDEAPVRHKELVLFFGGTPVVGSRGINAEFASRALESFQQVVSAKFASREGRVGSRGRIRGGDRSQMLLSDVTRGSFGFVLEQNNPDSGDDTGMSDTLSDVVDIIEKSYARDETQFNSISDHFDKRLLSSMQQFLKLLHGYGATMRIVSDERKFLMQHDDIDLARSRVDRIVTDDDFETFRGRLLFLPSSRRFELFQTDETVINGTIAADVMGEIMSDTGMPKPGIADTWCLVRLRVRKIAIRGQTPSRTFQLFNILKSGGKGPRDVY